MTQFEAEWRAHVEGLLMLFAMKATLSGSVAGVPERDLPRLLARIMVSHAASLSVLAGQGDTDWLIACIAERRNAEQARDRVDREEADAAAAAAAAIKRAQDSLDRAKSPGKSAGL